MSQQRGHDGYRAPQARRTGPGVPDTLLVGVLVMLILLPMSIWSAAELGGWFSHGHWPSVGFVSAALSIRHLVSRPAAFAAAWPRQARADLPSAGTFWSLWGAEVVVFLALAGWLLFGVQRRRALRRAEQVAVTDYLATRRARYPDLPPDR